MTIDHEYTRNIVCPYCGHEDEDSWEYNMRDGDEEEIICDVCWGIFRATCDVSVTYSTERKESGWGCYLDYFYEKLDRIEGES